MPLKDAVVQIRERQKAHVVAMDKCAEPGVGWEKASVSDRRIVINVKGDWTLSLF